LEPFCKEAKGAEKRRDFKGDFGERFRGIETKEGFKIANFFLKRVGNGKLTDYLCTPKMKGGSGNRKRKRGME
jgi:hypothetical protein